MTTERRDLPPCGVYAITSDRAESPAELCDAVAQAIEGGASVIQYRRKHLEAAVQRREAAAACRVARELGVCFIVNDDLPLARAIAADGVHLGRDDGDFRGLRSELGPDFIVGVSCYRSVERALEAAAAGASYVAFGSFFPSQTKPSAPPCPLSVLEEARRLLAVPLVAIGGITPENGGALRAAGADFLAIISGIFDARDIAAAARRYHDIFEEHGAETRHA
jgi:thiamine-phosphate pyrophosphorylase